METFHAENPSVWREWLVENHLSADSVWLVLHNKSSAKNSITWREAVDEALCFGWIDSKKVKIDTETSHQIFSKRRAKSTWSKINKDKVEELIACGKMSPAGYKSIEIAKENGSWTSLDSVEALVIPDELEEALAMRSEIKEAFLALSKSAKKLLLYKVSFAKRPETRQKKIAEILDSLKK